MDNKKQKKVGERLIKPRYSNSTALAQSIRGKDTTSYEMIPGKTTMENIGTKADGTPNIVPSTTYTKRLISNKEYADRMKSPAKFINPQVDPATGQVLQPQPIPNRAGAPDRSLNSMQQMGSITDPGMQSAQQAAAFQKFNTIAQDMPPPIQMKSPAMSYEEPAMIIDRSVGAAVDQQASDREDQISQTKAAKKKSLKEQENQ
jgi:hypothetical protein